jgi:hypothetical protein
MLRAKPPRFSRLHKELGAYRPALAGQIASTLPALSFELTDTEAAWLNLEADVLGD